MFTEQFYYSDDLMSLMIQLHHIPTKKKNKIKYYNLQQVQRSLPSLLQ